MKKYLKVQMPDEKKMKCSKCGYECNFRFGDTCSHVDRVTVKSVIFFKNL